MTDRRRNRPGLTVLLAVATMGLLSSCYDYTQRADEESTTKSTGVEYAPQMYHSIPYEPLTQVTDTMAGSSYWKGEIETPFGRRGEFYNTIPYNEYGMNFRTPVAGTIPTGRKGFYYDDVVARSLAPDAYGAADSLLKNPFELKYELAEDSSKVMTAESEAWLAKGKLYYSRYCTHCHGEKGEGNGLVGEKFGGVTNYAAIYGKGDGHIYHVITHGKNRMMAHASQVSPEQRWLIANYVQKLSADLQ